MTQQQQRVNLELTAAEVTRALHVFYWRQIFALDSAVVKTQTCLARMEAFLHIQCRITEKQSNQISTL